MSDHMIATVDDGGQVLKSGQLVRRGNHDRAYPDQSHDDGQHQ